MKIIIAIILCLSSFSIKGQEFHTKFEYTDLINKGITIQNSYPKGGLKYTDLNGDQHVYLVFWSQITNETTSDLELIIDFPIEEFVLPFSLDSYFRLYLPSEKMDIKKEYLFNYGLDLQSFLDKNIGEPAKLRTIIRPNESYLFYVLALSNKGVNGKVRAGFELQEQSLIYKINNYQFKSGKIVTKD